jgi:hypothetical protein
VGKQGIINSLEQINTIPLLLSVRSGAAVSMPGENSAFPREVAASLLKENDRDDGYNPQPRHKRGIGAYISIHLHSVAAQ